MNPILRKAIDAKFTDLGIAWLRVESLTIRSSEKAIAATVWLEGEADLVEVTVLYQLKDDDLLIEEIETSKIWVTKAAGLYLAQKGSRFSLPQGLKGMAIRLLL